MSRSRKKNAVVKSNGGVSKPQANRILRRAVKQDITKEVLSDMKEKVSSYDVIDWIFRAFPNENWFDKFRRK